MDIETKTVRAKPLRDFTDAGTERRFTKDQVVNLSEGEAENFRFAGLIEIVADEAGAGEPAKTGRSRG